MAGEIKQNHFELAVWCGLFAAAALWPLMVFEFPAGQDLPNHFARVFILLNSEDPAIAKHFAVNWNPVPNLGWDIFGVTIGRILPLVWTLKLYLVLCFGATMGGVFLLNRAVVGQWSWVPLLATPFTFHAGFTKGFLSFNLGVGLALIACAAWASIPEKYWRRRLALAAAFSLVLFYIHLVAWGIYGLFVLGYQLNLLRLQWRENGSAAFRPWLLRTMRDALQALPPFIVMAGFIIFLGAGTELYGSVAAVGNPFSRIKGARLIINTGRLLPALFFLIVAVASFIYLIPWKKIVVLSPKYAFSIALLVLFFFILPDRIYSTHYIVWRLALGAVLLAIASGIPAHAINASVTRVSLAVFLVLTLGLSGWHAYVTHNSEVVRKDFLASIERIPAGQTLFAVHAGISAGQIEYDRIGIYHLGSHAISMRKVMTQSQFANPAQQPVRYRISPYSNLSVNGGRFLDRVEHKFDRRGLSLDAYLQAFQWISYYEPLDVNSAAMPPKSGFALIEKRGAFSLYCRTKSTGDGALVCPDGRAP